MTNFLPALRGSTRGFGLSKRLESALATAGVRFPSEPERSPSRSRADREFLPAALEIIEAPPSPIRLGMMVAICTLFAVAIAWSCLGRIDIVAVAAGKVQPQGRVKTIQSVETGRVATIAVTNGTHVNEGTVLFTLDPSAAQAEETEYSTNYKSFRAEALRRAAAIAGARGPDVPKIDWSSDMPPTLAAREDAVLASDLAQLRAQVSNLDAQLTQKSAERQRLEGTIAAQSALVATLSERVQMRTTLLSNGSGAKSAVLDARENYQTQYATLSYQQGQRGENEAAAAVARSEIEKAYQTFIADNEQKRAEAERQADDYAHKLARAAIHRYQMTVKAPLAGIVQGSSITTFGQVVNTGEEVMRIVPERTTLEVEAYLPNKDIGFVTVGQEAVVKVDSFPFTRYGTLKGTVARIATDAIPQPDADIAEAAPTRSPHDSQIGGGQHTRDLVFPVTIALATNSIEANGAHVPLMPGMTVSAEVKTGNRRMISYLLSPIMEVSSTAMHER